jgi:hypothetical protein
LTVFGVVRGDIDTRVGAVDDRSVKRVGSVSDEPAEMEIAMATSSVDVDRTSGQASPSAATATLAAAALMSTSAILTFVVGVFALTANDLVVSGPGYEYTFQITGWGWANIVTGMVLAAIALAVFLSASWARVAAIVVISLAIVVTFLWMPYYPTGAIVLITLDVVAIWAVATWNTSRLTG